MTKKKQNKTDLVKLFKKRLKDDPKDIDAAIGLSFYYNNNGNEKEIISVLESFIDDSPFSIKEMNSAFDKLLAYGYVSIGNLEKADDIVDRNTTDEPKSLDLFYLSTYLNLSFREFENAIESGKCFLSNFENYSKNNKRPMNESAVTNGHQSQTLNFVGSAYRELNNFDQASVYFEKSIEADSGNHLPYLNLVTMNRLRDNQETATKILEKGLLDCREVQELRMLKETLSNQTTVSACMIVKNEEEMLGDCLESIRNWVDEIIIVDTGSTDRTVEIAESYNAKVYHHPWEENFSLHRNQSIDYATSDWIFIIDADERVCQEDILKLKDAINRQEFEMISLNVYNIYEREQQTSTFLPSIRFFKRDSNFRYEGIVHNKLIFPLDTPTLKISAKLFHYGYDLSQEKMVKKFNRTKELLERELAENSDDIHALFNYSQLLRGQGLNFQEQNAKKIIESSTRAIELISPTDENLRHIRLMCLDQLAWTHFYTGDNQSAIKFAEQALAIKPNYLDPLLLMGHAYSREKNYAQAKNSYENYLKQQQLFDATSEIDNIILIHPDSRATAFFALATIAEIEKETQQAKNYYLETLKANSRHLTANSNLGNICKSEGNLREAEKFYLNQIEQAEKNIDSLGSLAKIYHDRKEFDEAEKYYKDGLSLEPENKELLLGYGKLCQELGKIPESEEILSKLTTVGDSNSLTQLEIANSYFDTNNFSKAAEEYKQLINNAEVTSEIYNNLGNCYFKMEDFTQAIKQYQKAIETSPVTNLAFRNLGMAFLKSNNIEGSLIYLKKFLESEPNNKEIIHLIADLSFGLSHFETALEYFESFLRIEPRNYEIIYKLSECYLAMGHTDSAALGFKQVLTLNPEFDKAKKMLESLEKSSESVIKFS